MYEALRTSLGPGQLILAAFVFHFIGKCVSEKHQVARTRALLAALGFVAIAFMFYAPRSPFDFGEILAMESVRLALLVVAFTGVFSVFFVLISSAYQRFVLAPLAWVRQWRRSRRHAKQMRRQEHEKLLQEAIHQRQWEAERPDRERRERMEREQRERRLTAERNTKAEREAVLFRVRLLYDRHAAEIQDSFPIERFEQYFEDFFPADLDLPTLNGRSRQLEEMILSFFVEEDSPAKAVSLSDIDAEYERRKGEIEASTQDQDTKDSLMARLEKWRAKTIREQTTY